MSVRGYVRCSNRIDKPLKHDRKWERYVSFIERSKLCFQSRHFQTRFVPQRISYTTRSEMSFGLLKRQFRQVGKQSLFTLNRLIVEAGAWIIRIREFNKFTDSYTFLRAVIGPENRISREELCNNTENSVLGTVNRRKTIESCTELM